MYFISFLFFLFKKADEKPFTTKICVRIFGSLFNPPIRSVRLVSTDTETSFTTQTLHQLSVPVPVDDSLTYWVRSLSLLTPTVTFKTDFGLQLQETTLTLPTSLL